MDALLDLLDRPIAFHRCFVGLKTNSGQRLGIAAALMLSQAIYWSKRTADPDGWFYKTAVEWEEETGLSRREQETARKRLRETGFWYEERRDVPARMYYRIDLEALAEALQFGAFRQTGMAESAKQEWRKAPNINRNTETTTETTTESTAPNGAGNAGSGGAERDGAAGQTRPKRKRKAPADIPAPIAIYRRWTNLYPKKPLWGKITATVSDLDLWSRVVENWVALGWNPRNVAGMLEFYQRGEIPGTTRARQPAQPERPAPRDAREVLKELGL